MKQNPKVKEKTATTKSKQEEEEEYVLKNEPEGEVEDILLDRKRPHAVVAKVHAKVQALIHYGTTHEETKTVIEKSDDIQHKRQEGME